MEGTLFSTRRSRLEIKGTVTTQISKSRSRSKPTPFRTKLSDKFDNQCNDASDSDTDDSEQDIKMNYGFKSENTPPPLKELAYFERDIWDLVENVKFTNHRNTFQKILAKDVKKINNTKEIIMKADKTKNWYNIKTENYLKLKQNTITQHYKKQDSKLVNQINYEAAKSVANLDEELLNKVEIINNKEAYITIKDHKPNFQHEP